MIDVLGGAETNAVCNYLCGMSDSQWEAKSALVQRSVFLPIMAVRCRLMCTQMAVS